MQVNHGHGKTLGQIGGAHYHVGRKPEKLPYIIRCPCPIRVLVHEEMINLALIPVFYHITQNRATVYEL